MATSRCVLGHCNRRLFSLGLIGPRTTPRTQLCYIARARSNGHAGPARGRAVVPLWLPHGPSSRDRPTYYRHQNCNIGSRPKREPNSPHGFPWCGALLNRKVEGSGSNPRTRTARAHARGRRAAGVRYALVLRLSVNSHDPRRAGQPKGAGPSAPLGACMSMPYAVSVTVMTIDLRFCSNLAKSISLRGGVSFRSFLGHRGRVSRFG